MSAAGECRWVLANGERAWLCVCGEGCGAPADPAIPCQRCGKTGGRVTTKRVGAGLMSSWQCPHCDGEAKGGAT